jgi:hypothetical protein
MEVVRRSCRWRSTRACAGPSGATARTSTPRRTAGAADPDASALGVPDLVASSRARPQVRWRDRPMAAAAAGASHCRRHGDGHHPGVPALIRSALAAVAHLCVGGVAGWPHHHHQVWGAPLRSAGFSHSGFMNASGPDTNGGVISGIVQQMAVSAGSCLCSLATPRPGWD